MDLDVFVTAHRAEWDRLDALLRRRRRLTGAEADELVALYQRTATHLSLLQSSAPDPALTSRLTHSWPAPAARSPAPARPPGATPPASSPRASRRGLPLAPLVDPHRVLSTAVAALIGWWISHPPRGAVGDRAPRSELREHDPPRRRVRDVLLQPPRRSFAAQVWTNNAQAAAMCLVLGAFLGLPVLWILFQNMLNLGVGIGLMSSAGRLDTFLGLILPHGLLELTAVFVAAGTGLRLGLDPHRPGPPHPPDGPGRRRPRRPRHGHRPRRWSSSSPAPSKASSPRPACPPGPASPSASPPNWPSSLYVYVLGGRAARPARRATSTLADRRPTVPTAA